MARYITQAADTATRWQEQPRGQVSKRLFEVARSVHQRTRWMAEKDRLHSELYECEGALDDTRAGKRYRPSTLPRNVIRKAVDTLVAKVAKERPLPQVFTSGGTWAEQKRARRASEAIEGEFGACKVFEQLVEQWLTDALVARAGVLKVCELRGRVHVERVLPWELHVDPIDARYGAPQTIYHVRTAARRALAALFPRHRKAIMSASADSTPWDWDRQTVGEPAMADRLRVVETWSLPSAPGAADGRHVIAIEGVDLLDEPWVKSYFPFPRIRFKPRRVGWWGVPLAEILEGWHAEQSLVQESVSNAHAQAPGGIVAVPIGSEIVDQHIVNDHWTVLKHRPGAGPVFHTPNPVSPQTYGYLRDLDGDALNDAGISQMSAHSTKPTGITAARALMVLDDSETERFAMLVRGYQAACVELAEMMLDVMRDIAERDGDYHVSAFRKRRGRDLSWASDFAIDRERHRVTVFNTSLLAKRPEARFNQLEQWLNAGFITPEQFFRLSEMPDMARESDIMSAGRDLVDEQLGEMLDAEDPEAPTAYLAPNPYGDLDYARKRAQLTYCLATIERAPEGNLALVRRYIEDVNALLESAAPHPQPPAAPMPPPGAPPEPPP